MKLKKGFITHMLGDEQIMVAAGPAAQEFHGLVRSNETAAFIIDCLKSDVSESDIVARILETYDVSAEIAQKDVRKILEKLQEIGAIA